MVFSKLAREGTENSPSSGSTGIDDVTPPQPQPSGESSETMAIERQQAQVEARIKQLEELQALQDKERALLESLQLPLNENPPNHRREPRDSSSSTEGEVKIKNIIELALPTTVRKRDDWLRDLHRAFNGARRRYRKGYKKILLALDHMDQEGRARWDRYLEEHGEIRRHELEEDWKAFEEWTLGLIKDAENRDVLLMSQLERAKQREGQTPQDFHLYLDSLEKHFPRHTEKQKALFYFSKLRYELRDHISLNSPNLPQSRDEMVTLATRYWDTMVRQNKRKNNASGGQQQKKARREPSGASPNFPRINAEATPQRRGNPRDRAGNLLKCHSCGSTEHLLRSCPKPRRVERLISTKNHN